MAFNIYSVDEAKQSEGTWVEFEGSEFCIAYANNPTFLKEKKRLERPFKRQIERGTMNAGSLVKHLLLVFLLIGRM
jgi:hypothetical protein